MGRRGFFAELHYRAKKAENERYRAATAAQRARLLTEREAEKGRKADERAAAQLARATATERKRLEKEALKAHQASMEAEAERRNAELAVINDDLDSLLVATLDVDDYVDLESLRVTPTHPPFHRLDLEQPIPPLTPIPDPAEPVFSPPPPPGGILGLIAKGRHAKAVERARADHERAVSDWRSAMAEAARMRVAVAEQHSAAERARIEALEGERARYQAQCAAREAEVEERNKALDQLIANLGYGVADAVQEYVSIVLSNSVYPDHFPVTHDFEFAPGTAELRLRVLVPPPDVLPSEKAFKYTKSSDEIVSTPLSQKALRDRYSDAVLKVALRSLHEIFEADRRGIIKTISMEVGTDTIDPATGLRGFIPFVATGAEREQFLTFDLSQVVPAATLAHLGAAVSKNPIDLVAADTSGIRTS